MTKRPRKRTALQTRIIVAGNFKRFREGHEFKNRKKKKITPIPQEDIGKILGLHQTAICRIELGQQEMTPHQLDLSADFFDVEVKDFFIDWGKNK